VQDLYSTGIKLLEEFEKNTRVCKLGVATTFYMGSENTIRLSFALDGRFFTDNYNPDSSGLIFDLCVGSEVAFSEWLMFRAGMKNIYFPSFFQGFPAGLSLGFTLRQWGFGFDYAVTFEDSDAQTALDLLLRVGLSYRFGMSIDEKRAKELERLQLQIKEEIREATSQYESQLEKLTQDYETQRQQLMEEMNRQNQERIAAIEKTIEKVRQQTISELSEEFEEEKRESQEELARVYEQQLAELGRRLLDEKDLSEQQRADLERQIQQLTEERSNVELQLESLQGRVRELVNVLSVQFEEEKRKSLEDLASIARNSGALFLVDMVTSLGGMEVALDSMNIDVAYSGTQKCISCPPGLSPISFSPKAMEVLENRKTPVVSWYLDMSMVSSYWGAERKYHHTAPVNMIYGLREALRIIAEEGLETRFARHQQNHKALVAGVEAMGLSMLVPKNERLPMLNAVRIPEGADDLKARKALLSQFGIEIGGGLGDFAGKIWRVGLMGHASRQKNVFLFLSALETVLKAQGVKLNPGALEAASGVYGEA